MDAIGIGIFSIGGFLLYASVRGEHPWSLFLKVLGASTPSAPDTSTINNAPYTGPINSQGLGAGTTLAGGGTNALHG